MASIDRFGNPLRDDPFRGNVRVVATTNITLSGLQTIDGVTLESGDRVLAQGQSTASQNGVYVAKTGAWTRARDLSTSDDFKGPIIIAVEEGTVGRNKLYSISPSGPVTVDTTSLTFAEGYPSFVIGDGAVTLAKLANQNEATALFRLPNAGSGPPIAATMQQVRASIGMFDTRAALAASYMASVLNYARTAGYTAQGDGGGALYKRKASEPGHPGKVQSADGTWWEIAESDLNFYQFGAIGDGSTDDRDAIADCIECASELGGVGTGRRIVVPAATFAMGSSVTVPDNNNGQSQLLFEGCGRYTSFIKALASFTGTELFDLEGVADFQHIGWNGNGETISCFTNNQATATDIPTKIHHCEFLSFAGTSGVYRNNDNGVYYFHDNRVSSCYHAIYNYDWGTQSRIFNNDILTTDIAIILDNQGHSNEGIIIQNNLIGSVNSHGIQINHGLDIQVANNEITPIQSYASGSRGVVVTGSAGPVRFVNNWIEGVECETGSVAFQFIGNYFPTGSGIEVVSPVAGAVSGWEIASNIFAGAGAAARVALTNCANMNVHDNQSAGPFYETGGTLEMIFDNNILAGTSAFSAACILRCNRGGTGYTNVFTTGPAAVAVTGTFRATGTANFGDGGGTNAMNLLKNLDSQQWFALRNSNAGSSASSGFLFGDDGTAARGALVVHSSGRTDLAGANSLNFGTYGNDNVGFFTGNTLRLMLRGSDGVLDYKQAAVTSGAPFTNTAKVPIYINGVAYNVMLCA